jgi:hypothetical protein
MATRIALALVKPKLTHLLLQTHRTKTIQLVEVNDPLNTSSQERIGLSAAQESEMVHRKLEGFASQYYPLLKSQLEQQRIYFEGQLEEIRREHSSTTNSNKERKALTTADLVTALKAERSQLSQRLDTFKDAECQGGRGSVLYCQFEREPRGQP